MKQIYFEDLAEGDVMEGYEVLADPDEMMAYNRLNDPWPIHIDEAAAAASPFGGIIASGGYTITLMYRSLQGIYNNADLRWEFLGGLDWQLKFPRPVRPGDRLTSRITVLSKRRSSKPGRGVVTNLTEMLNQDGEVTLSNEVAFLMVARTPGATNDKREILKDSGD